MITVVGSLNMDFVINAEAIPRRGETVFGRSFQRIPGGRGGNQAAAAAQLGSEVTMIGAVGTDELGEELITSLKKSGVKTDYILKKEGIPTGAKFIMAERSGNSGTTLIAGANHALAVEDVERYHLIIEQSTALITQLEPPLLTVKKAMMLARRGQCLTILNPAPAEKKLDAGILSNTDVLTLNRMQLELLSGCPAGSAEGIEAAGSRLLKKGVRQLVVNLGEEGCFSINRKRMDRYPAGKDFSAEEAAEDCFTGALAVALSEGKAVEDAIPFAISARIKLFDILRLV